ncbi:hypothetical protein BDL97_06G128500 [Sphagnum fallax]|nr:hypothetical protein BDL97_06G128500 [Sphagnum fallax]
MGAPKLRLEKPNYLCNNPKLQVCALPQLLECLGLRSVIFILHHETVHSNYRLLYVLPTVERSSLLQNPLRNNKLLSSFSRIGLYGRSAKRETLPICERIGAFGVMDFRLAAWIIELVLLGYDGVMVCSVDKRQQTLGRGRRVQFGYGSCAVYCTRCSFCTALLFHKMTHITSSRVLQSGNHQLVYTFSEFWTCCLSVIRLSTVGGFVVCKQGQSLLLPDEINDACFVDAKNHKDVF